MVAAGTFQYRGEGGCALMTPGSLLLGNPGQYFVCSHDHGAGDRCIAFQYEPEYFERLACDAGMAAAQFRTLKVPPSRELSPLVATCSGRS
jgi:AraC family transcriptional regulator